MNGSDRKSTRLNSSHSQISYAVFCLKKKTERVPCAVAFKTVVFLPMAISAFATCVTWRTMYQQHPDLGAVNALATTQHVVVDPQRGLPRWSRVPEYGWRIVVVWLDPDFALAPVRVYLVLGRFRNGSHRSGASVDAARSAQRVLLFFF